MPDILCAACGSETRATAACGACGASPLLDERYTLLAVVGRGAMGTTYRAEVVATGAQVAVKEMLVRAADFLKQRELFGREAEVLRTLDHPGVPRYVDHFDSRAGKVWNLYVVQDFVEGSTLEAERKDRRYTEPEVCETLAAACDILAYIHTLRPAVVHRDLKPGNIMRRPDGALVLIDFGSVKSALDDPDLGGSTVAGTFGFMAPEQLLGRAAPASDLFALGMCAAVMLTRRDAVDLLQHDGRVAWRPHTKVTPALAALVDELLQRDVARRPQDAAQLAERLRAIAKGAPDPHAAALVGPGEGEVDLRVQLPPAPRPSALTRHVGVSHGAAMFLIPFGLLFGGIGGTLGAVFLGIGLFAGGPVAFVAVGGITLLVFGGIGLGCVVVGGRTVLAGRRLLQGGRVTEGLIEDAEPNRNVRVNGRNPLRVTYRYRVDGVDYTNTEDRYDRGLPADLSGARVTVLVASEDPGQSLLAMKGRRGFFG